MEVFSDRIWNSEIVLQIPMEHFGIFAQCKVETEMENSIQHRTSPEHTRKSSNILSIFTLYTSNRVHFHSFF